MLVSSMGLPKTPLLTTDAIILDENNDIVLIKRKNNPYKDHWAIPGGFVEIGESVEESCIREAKEETNLDVEIISLIGVYSRPNRDPRGHTVTVAFLTKPVSGELRADTDAKEVKKINISKSNNIDLAFDHNEIMADAINLINIF